MLGSAGRSQVGCVQIVNRLCRGVLPIAGLFLLNATFLAQNPDTAKSINIVVQALDGRNGKPLANQRLLVFTGLSLDAAKSHAEHTSLTTDKEGIGALTIYPAETQWIQVWADGRVLCQPDPNQSGFSVPMIMSTGLAAPNNCGPIARKPLPSHLVIFARPGRFIEKIKH